MVLFRQYLMFTRSNGQKINPRSPEVPFNLVLPMNFADEVLNQEISLDSQLTIPKISRLMELYSVNFNQGSHRIL